MGTVDSSNPIMRPVKVRTSRKSEREDADGVVQVEPEAAAGGAAVDRDALDGPPEIDARDQEYEHGDAGPGDDGLAGVGAVGDEQAQMELVDVAEEIAAVGAYAEDFAGVGVDGDHSTFGGDADGDTGVGGEQEAAGAFAREGLLYRVTDFDQREAARHRA